MELKILRIITRCFGAFISSLVCSGVVSAQVDPWEEMVSRASDSVVSLQLAHLRDFNLDDQGGGGATGFVVDAKKGIILTNRHVIGDGPIRANATFQNQERVDLVPLYRDPIHDFGFFRYKPSDLKYAQPESLQLHPEKVDTGMNIRVIGSDGGEQLSILTGTIARIDRQAPNYGRYDYNDFNTFYFQAASSTSGGSSGSPVLNAEGQVVALNAAANARTASSFFLPLDRISRALKLLQEGKEVPRGTLQTIFRHKPFRELRRLGLDADTESVVRESDKKNNGMLTVRQIFPGGTAAGVLQEGDILVEVNNQPVAQFVLLEDILDQSVGSDISLRVLRQGETTEVLLTVVDLHALTPDRFIEMGDSILQDMSLQHVRGMNIAKQGVVLAKAGFLFQEAGIQENAVITSINNQQIKGLQDLIDLLQADDLSDRWLIRYTVQGREFFSELAQLKLDNRWYRYRECERRDDERFWQCDVIPVEKLVKSGATVTPVAPKFENPVMQKVAPAMVWVDFNIPYIVDNVFSQHFSGAGLVVDPENGLISVDRNTVPISMGEATVTFFGSFEVPAEVVFLHPQHNLALLKYDPELLQGVDIPVLEFVQSQEEPPQDLFRLSFRQDGTYQVNAVGSMNRVTVAMDAPRLPRFQQSTVDVYTATNMPPSLGGPVIDSDGLIHAVWMSFAYQEGKDVKEAEWALPAGILTETLKSYRENNAYYSLDTSLYYQSLAEAIQYGLNDEWLQRFQSLPATQRRVLMVQQTVPGSDAAAKLRAGDVLLSINGEMVTDLQSAESLAQQPKLDVEILRAGAVENLQLLTSKLDGQGTDRVVSWAGAMFQEPHRDIAVYEGINIPGVYIAYTEPGSPALWDRLYRNRMIVEVNGQAITGLDDFLERIRLIKQDEITRLTTVSLSGRREITSVAAEYYFWPTFEIRREAEGWKRTDYASSNL